MNLITAKGAGSYGPFTLDGNYVLGVTGDFSGATVQVRFKSPGGTDYALNTADWSFTAAPPYPQAFGFPYGVRFYIDITGGTAPSITIDADRYHG